MASTPRNLDTNSRIERLERLVANLQRQSTLSSASISEGNLTIRRGGSIRVIDDGSIIGEGTGVLDWAGDAAFGGNLEIDGTTIIGGSLDIDGTTHIGGDLTIDGNTILGGNLQFGDNVIPPEALARRTEARTFSAGGEGNGNTRTQSLTVSVPSWVNEVSVIAIGTSAVTAAALQILSRVTIDGNQGPEMFAASDLSVTVSATHGRTFNPGGNFTIQLFAGAQGVDSHFWVQSLVAMAVFTN